MKSTRWESKFIASVVCGLTALATPAFSDGWVTVNPDGSVTRTEVQGPQPFEHGTVQRSAPVGIAAGRPSTGLARGFEPTPQTHTSSSHRRTRRVIQGGGHHHHGTYPYPAYPAYPSYPAYPTYPAPAPGYYSYPAPVYSGPIGPPVRPPFTSPWITSVPTVGTYYYTPSPYPPTVVYPAPAPAYPYYPPTYGHYPGHSSTTYGQVTIGGGGVSVTLGGSRSSSSTSTTTTTTITR